jgi:hypothetical protein
MSSDDEALSGQLVPAPPPADIRYDDKSADDRDRVANVLVVVTYGDGHVKEYEAREPADWQMNDPESFSAQVFRQTGLGIGSGSRFRGITAGVPSLRLSFTANPRYNLHIRNKRSEEKALP